MAKTIWEYAPPHKVRLIPFAGGLGEFWGWDPTGVSEVVNDVDRHIVNLYKVWQDDGLMRLFQRRIEAVPFGRDSFDEAKAFCENLPLVGVPDVTWACHTFTLVRMSMLGGQKSLAAISHSRIRGGMNEQVSAWLSAVDGLPQVHARLKRVVLENRPAVEFLQKYASADTFTYADPPYHPSVRTPGLYRCEMDAAQHDELLACLKGLPGRVMLSGYSCPEYETALAAWRRVEVAKASAMTKAETKSKRVEVLWLNY